MKKLLKLSVLFLLSLLAFTTAQALNAKASDTSTSSITPTIGQQIPLTNDQIKATWPNLPTAQEIYGKVPCSVINLDFNGKQASSVSGIPDPNSPTVEDMSSTIVNCTTTEPDYYNGGLFTGPQVWEQFNSTLWVDVPLQYLQTSSNLSNSPLPATTTPPTWAIGAYQDPSALAGSYSVWGACSFGEYTQTSFSSPNYVGVCVVSVSTSNYVYQMVMQLDSGGKSVVDNIIVRSTGKLYQTPSQSYVSNAALNNLYNTYVRYITGTGWAFGWNWTNYFTFTLDSNTQILVGNQPTAVVETNDFNSSDFSSWATQIGGNYTDPNTGTTYPLAEACYLFNGNWYPITHGQNDPQTWAYLGGNQVGTWGSLATQGPPTNWTSNNVGESVLSTAILKIGHGQTLQTNGNVLWYWSTL